MTVGNLKRDVGSLQAQAKPIIQEFEAILKTTKKPCVANQLSEVYNDFLKHFNGFKTSFELNHTTLKDNIKALFSKNSKIIPKNTNNNFDQLKLKFETLKKLLENYKKFLTANGIAFALGVLAIGTAWYVSSRNDEPFV